MFATWVVEPRPGAEAAVSRAVEVFAGVEAACTRFDPDSPLMRGRMRELIKVPNPHSVRTPPPTRPVWPESLAAEPLDRPWRDIDRSELLP